MNDLIPITCPECRTQFATGAPVEGKQLVCPGCAQPLAPLPAVRRWRRRRRPRPEGVPVNIQLPGGSGNLQAQVSQRAADSMGHTLLGGLLVALGGILAWFLFTDDHTES